MACLQLTPTPQSVRRRMALVIAAMCLVTSVASTSLDGSPARRNLLSPRQSVVTVTVTAPGALPSSCPSQQSCPTCFNCNTQGCMNFGSCSNNGCSCPQGFGGQDCSTPVCNSTNVPNGLRELRTGPQCQCDSGFSGVNCEVCTQDSACQAIHGTSEKPVCNSSPKVWTAATSYCTVDSPLLSSVFPGQSVLSLFRNYTAQTTLGSLWHNNQQQFTCQMTDCAQTLDPSSPAPYNWNCGSLSCQCVGKSEICGGFGSVFDLSSNVRSANGNMKFSCGGNGTSCNVFFGFLGDLFPNGLNLPSCSFGECALPSDQPPDNLIGATPKLTTGIKIGVALAGAGFVFIAASLAWCAVMSRKAKLMPIAPPRKGSTLAFDKLSYNLQNGKKILNQVSGVARAGQVFAIMGPSGAGKSTFLDIIAAKEKRGKISGSVLTDGRELHPSAYRSLIGFVDQEDLLMPTLTVRETLMFSATLRLPECISALERTRRVDEIIATLGLTHIANSRVGGFGFRGISGGEKRRLSIGVELVTSPAVLFLDEPTSGLDSSSALSVVRTLADLAHVHGKTVVFTIHQPRSDVFTLFDQVLVLARGSTVYCGPARDAGSYFREHGAPCPEGYNIADHLLDIATLHGTPAAAGVGGKHYGSLTRRRSKGEFPNRIGTVVRMVDGALTGGCEALAHTLDMDLVAHSVSGSLHTPSPPRPRKPRAPPAATRDASTPSPDPTLNPEDLDATAGADADSISGSGSTFTAVPAQTHARRGSSSSSTTFTGPARLPPPSPPPPPPAIPSSRYQTSFLTQVNALLRRSTLSLIRTPSLLLAHLSLSLLLGVLVGALYYKSGTTLGGIQNRLGGILFLLLLVGFSSLSAVGGVARERALMSRERSGNCYGVLPMFISRLLVDTVALRILPAIVLGTVVFVLVGFNGGLLGYLRFIGVIVLFAMQMGLLCVGVGVAVEEVGTGTLGASIGILFMMLFAGFLINKDDIPKPLSWMQYLSYFKYAQEALAVNDLTGVQISDSIAGSDISIPASIVLQKFGFDMNAYYPDLFISIAMTVKLLVVVLIMMKLLIREKR